MKKVVIFLAVMPLALLALSCTKDIEGSDAPVIAPVFYETVSFHASFDDPATRTNINTATGKVFWEEGDKIYYYCKAQLEGGEVEPFEVGELRDNGTTDIKIGENGEPNAALQLDTDATFAIAVHGGTGLSNRVDTGCTIEGALPAEQTGKFQGSHIAVARITKNSGQWPENIVFSNVLSFVSFEIDADSKVKDADYAIFKSGANEILHANGNLNVKFDSDNKVNEVKLPSGAGGTSIRISISEKGPYYIALAPGGYTGFTLSFFKKNDVGPDEYLGTASSDKALDLTYKVVDGKSKARLVKLGKIPDSEIKMVATDLSSGGKTKANCYVVSEPGQYKIPIGFEGSFTPKVVWESTMTEEAPATGSVVSNLSIDNEGYLHFTSGVDGNAVIGVYNTSCVWSWHIWVKEGFDPAALATSTANGKVMDRALGALSADKSGLLYQWGRKDPFLADGLASTPKFNNSVESSEIYGTVEVATKYPNTLITGVSVSNYDWVYIGSNNISKPLWSNVKTDYDPCPAGWQLPAAFGDDAKDWVVGKYWSYVTYGVKSLAFNGTEPVATNRDELAMVRCVAEKKVDVSEVLLDKTSVTIAALGQTAVLNASISPVNATAQTVQWSVTPEGIVSFVETGNNQITITGEKVGSCKITAEADGKSASCDVVCGTPVTSVKINAVNPIVAPGAQKQLSVTVLPENATVKTVTWSTEKPSIATVDQNGLVTGVAEGTCTITATAHNGEKDDLVIEVADHKVYDLSQAGKANCYIVSAPGDYSFVAKYRGNSYTSVGDLTGATAVELWSTINSSTAPMSGTLIKNVELSGDMVTFTVPEVVNGDKKMIDGNAVIAVREGNTILWSWHIWLLEGYSPEATAQTYFNNGGIMMDRNLGALSAEANDPKSVGFLYQWGRKDPFPACQQFYGKTPSPYATSPSWPSAIGPGSIETSVRNPMNFMKATAIQQDWYDYSPIADTLSKSPLTVVFKDPMVDSRWNKEKTEYDPCPAGWRVPDGAAYGVWSTAFGRSDGFSAETYWLSGRYGYNFNGLLGNNGETMIWYPATAYLNSGLGNLSGQGQYAMYWSCTPCGWNSEYKRMDAQAYQFYFYANTSIQPAQSYVRAQGCAVRCLKEGSFHGVPLKNLSIGTEGTKSMSITIKEGETKKLPLIFNPSNASNQTIRVSSMEPSSVYVDANANVTGKKVTYGPVEISVTAADGEYRVTCMVSVVAATGSE